MKYDSHKYADIQRAYNYLGSNIAEHLLQFYSLTGCDSTSYFYRVGKIKVWKKLMKQTDELKLIESVGKTKHSTEDIENCQKFVQTVMYSGKEDEHYVDTQVRLYKSQSTKTSLSLPPDPDSFT